MSISTINDGVEYNTDTATLVAEWSNGYTDSGFCYEALYKTEDDRYFLYGTGGEMSEYSEYYDNETIIPLGSASAMEWGEKGMSVREYEAEFGTMPEFYDDKVIYTCITISADVNRTLLDYAKANKKTIHYACDSLLRSVLSIDE